MNLRLKTGTPFGKSYSQESGGDHSHYDTTDTDDPFADEPTESITSAVTTSFATDTDTEEDDEDQPEGYVPRPPPKRREIPLVKHKPNQTNGVLSSEHSQKARLSADINPALRERAKIFSIRQNKPFCLILEGWIREHCPEP